MAAAQETPDRIATKGSAESLSKLTIKTEERPISVDAKEQPISANDEVVVSASISQNTTPNDPPSNATGKLTNPDAGGEHIHARPPNIYTPQPHTIYYGGYNNVSGDWDEYFQYLNQEGMDLTSPGIYNENPSLMFHTGYGYNPQVPYGPYSPVTTPLPSSRGDGQIYSPQQFPITGPYFQQPLPPNLSFLNSPTPLPQGELPAPVVVEQRGAFLSDTSNSNSVLSGPKPNDPSHGSFVRSNFSGNSGHPSFYDSRQGFDGFGSGGLWSDWSKSSDSQKSLASFYSPLASPQPIGTHGAFQHGASPFAYGPTHQQQRPFYGFGSSISSFDGGYSRGSVHYQGTNFGANLGTSSRGWITNDKGRRRGKGDASLYSCNGTLDFLNEQSRGPRATRTKSSTTEQNSSMDSKGPTGVDRELYNKSDFVVEYKDAKFFIIKSYSEDNVHKSIKYGVWASTPNGNRKLDAAYHEAKEKGCPVFLLFSVNSSAQFCGVAEMIGPVDFDKSVDYWQQDKWSGNFPVKWHIVKDVPNGLFRHIILANNDNKPVTNSRDTQEVELEQGLEMLSLLKGHESETSILDDFDFYEERQKAMQERKSLQQQQQQQQSSSKLAFPLTSTVEQRRTLSIPNNVIDQLSMKFTHMVHVDEMSKENITSAEKDGPAVTEVKAGDKTELTMAGNS